MSRNATVLVLPGDGIGPEVTAQGLRVMEVVATSAGVDIAIREDVIHGQAWDRYGTFCRDETVEAAKSSDAVLLGAVGGPKWEGLVHEGLPETKDGLMRLRKELDVFAGLRPAWASRHLAATTPYRSTVIAGTDLVVLREMCGGIMFAPPRGIERTAGGGRRGVDTQAYDDTEIARHARVGFELARRRRGGVVSVDKANVMESGVLWREVVADVGREYPEVELTHMYADNCAYQLAIRPTQFDVLLTDNLFGDILSDQIGSLAGSLAMLPSACLAGLAPIGHRTSPGIYEPAHGSAPDIAGRGVANPIGMILSVAMMFEFGLALPVAAEAIRSAVDAAIGRGVRTRDLGGQASTAQMTDAILRELEA